MSDANEQLREIARQIDIQREKLKKVRDEFLYLKKENDEREWMPNGGEWYINGGGGIEYRTSISSYTLDFGTERNTRELAEKARDKMRFHNRLLAYVDEHAPDWDGSDAWTVFYSINHGRYECGQLALEGIGSIQGPCWVMEKLADDLNSGRFK